MEHDKNMIVIYTCQSCSSKNRVANSKKTGGRWKCGKCGIVLLHRKAIFHESLMLNVRYELEEMLIQLKEIRFPVFSQKRIKEIEAKNEKCRSKIENWVDHLSYLKDENEKKEIMDSYNPDIKEIESLTLLISDEIKDARWLREKLSSIDIVRKVVVSMSLTMKAMAVIFKFFGLDGLVTGLVTSITSAFNAILLE